MTPDTQIPIDRAHYDMIVVTADRTERIEEMLAVLSDRIANCPCPAVVTMRQDVDDLRLEMATLKRTIAIVAGVATFVANAIIAVLPRLFGGGTG